MGMTMTQKILAAHAGLPSVSAGQLIEADLDLVLGNDITSPVAIHEMDKMKVDGVFDKDKIALVLDHFVFSCTSLGVKLGGGIGVALSGWLLDISGYINLDNAVQPDSCINMMYFMYLWLPFIFDIIITVILSFLNVESANMKLKENMQNQ